LKDENKTKSELIRELNSTRTLIEKLENQMNSETQFGSEDKDQLLQMITDNVSDLIAILDTNGKRLYNSKSYKNILGDPEKLKGTDSFKEIHPEDRDKIKKIFSETVKKGTGQRAEYRFVQKNGNVRHIESQGNVIKDETGKVSNVLVVARDITEREAIETALFESEERLRSILKSIPDIVYRLNPNGKITFISEAVQRYGYNPEDLLGMNIFDLVHPEDKEKAIYRINERRTGERRTKSLELRLITAKGEAIYFEDRSESIPMDPVFLLEAEGLYKSEQPDGKNFIGTQGIARDITQRKKTEEEISVLAQALRCISESVCVTDLENNIMFVNDAFVKTYGYERDELIGQPISMVRTASEQYETLDKMYPKSIASGWQGEVLNKNKEGVEFPVHNRMF
jgi:PAS domain S-box-containing protein